jgi:hypothetical protein
MPILKKLKSIGQKQTHSAPSGSRRDLVLVGVSLYPLDVTVACTPQRHQEMTPATSKIEYPCLSFRR